MRLAGFLEQYSGAKVSVQLAAALLFVALPAHAQESLESQPLAIDSEESLMEDAERPAAEADFLADDAIVDSPPYDPMADFIIGADGKPMDPCEQFDAENNSWIDKTQIGLYETVCQTAGWFDSFFGDYRYTRSTADTFGRVSMGGYWDQRDGFDPRLRFRARFALPSMRNRGSFFIGRGDEKQLIEERGAEQDKEPPQSADPNEDDSLFAGFGFSRSQSMERGFDLDVGVKLRLPPEPFVKAKYRYGWQLAQNTLLRTQPVVYWRSEEKFGATLSMDVDHVINDRMLFRWSNYGNVSEDPNVQGMNWGSAFTLYQARSNKRGLTNSLFVRGETEAEEKLQNYGYEIRYRRRVLRESLFLEYIT